MRALVRSGSLWLACWIAVQPVAVCGQAPQAPKPPVEATSPELAVPKPKMNVAVVEGEAAINNIRKQKGNDIVVLVRDGNRNPLPRATVTFTFPPEGASAAVGDGRKTATVTAGSDGYAVLRGIKPNRVPGTMVVQVEAKHQDQTATATVTQFNMNVESKGSSTKWLAVLGIVGAAAAGGAVMALRNSNGTTATPAAPPTPIGITPGPGSVGPPR